jgi:hypothetical protein
VWLQPAYLIREKNIVILSYIEIGQTLSSDFYSYLIKHAFAEGPSPHFFAQCRTVLRIRIRTNPKLFAESGSEKKFGFGYGFGSRHYNLIVEHDKIEINEKTHIFSQLQNFSS